MVDSVTGYQARAELEDMIERDLLGPWDGLTEELPAGTTPGASAIFSASSSPAAPTGRSRSPTLRKRPRTTTSRTDRSSSTKALST